MSARLPQFLLAVAIGLAALGAVPARGPALAGEALPGSEDARARTPLGFEAVADSYVTTVTERTLVGMTLSNYGFVGNNFISRKASLEYPLDTGFEHMVRGGLWIGARAFDENDIQFFGVTTATVDGTQGGSSTQSATEFTPASNKIQIRSSLTNKPEYDPKAVSERDYITSFRDHIPTIADNTSEPHKPLRVVVRQENYSWSYSDFQHFIVFHYVIRNDGQVLDSMYVGFYGEFQSGPKGAYSNWPPTAAGSSQGGWYGKKWIEFDAQPHDASLDSVRLFREHYCNLQPIPDGCNLGLVPYWIGVKLLTPPDASLTPKQKETFSSWDYAPPTTVPDFFARDEDRERYDLMASGKIQTLPVDSLLPGSMTPGQGGDPIVLFSIGPFMLIDPGDSIQVDFAIVGGADTTEIRRHAQFAQRAYDRHYVLAKPPESPRFKVVARQNGLDLYWDHSPENAVDPTSPVLKDFEGYRVYLRKDCGQPECRVDLDRIAQFDLANTPHDTTGFNTGFDAIRVRESRPGVPGDSVNIAGVYYHYKYSVEGLQDGFKYFAAVTSYDLGSVDKESLESGIAQNKLVAIPSPAPGENGGSPITVFPNPYRVEATWDQGDLVRDHYLWFANLPRRCILKIFTLSGDMVFQTDFNGDTYQGQGARGIYDPSKRDPAPTLSGASFGWNMITHQGQAAATGLYLYSVEDRDTGKRTRGKFLIVKSDREGF